MTPLRITVPVGTRPEVIKLATVVSALRRHGHAVRCVATGQHVDAGMYAQVFADLGMAPDVVWELGGTEGDRVAALLSRSFDEVETHRPDLVLVLGDTYTAPLFAMAARRHRVGVAHLEAGLRSFNETSMEESNRRMVAALATLHLAPTAMAAGFLADEGVPASRVRVVGNPVIDTLRLRGVQSVPVDQRRGVLVTAHRATNVDDPARLRELVLLVRSLGELHAPVLFPLHPRTRARLSEHGLLAELAEAPGVRCTEPLPYPALLEALASSRVAVTDSGGLQEEASWFGVPVVVMRSTTPRWEGVRSGAAVLTGLSRDRAVTAVDALAEPAEQRRIADLPCPYGDGHTAARVVEVLDDPEVRATIPPREPSLGQAPMAVPGTSR
jgi:UDP-N-acetylglucosamine 2-epimerase (non-hydrolysing)